MKFCRIIVKYLIVVLGTVLVLDYFGAFSHVFEIDFYKEFHYPIDDENVIKYANQVRRNLPPDVNPINQYNYSFLNNPDHKCKDKEGREFLLSPRIVFIIKSGLKNLKKRNAIRSTWGYERRFSDVIIRTVFLLGKHPIDTNLQDLINIEAANYQDIVQADFDDTYFNNTIKTMTGFRWAVEFCPRSRFYMFVDDDYYVSAKNVLRFVRNPVYYPEYLEDADETIRQLARKLSENRPNNSVIDLKEISNVLEKHNVAGSHSRDSRLNLEKIRSKFEELKKQIPHNEIKREAINSSPDEEEVKSRQERQLLDLDLPLDVKLYSGFVIQSTPHRHKTSKWHVSLDEYPYHMWPPYVSAGAYILSREALIQMYYVSMFTKHFRFDDIFLSIVAIKSLIEPLHSGEFYVQKPPYRGPHSYRYVIASHDYGEPTEMLKVWSEVRAAGHA